jgi:deoxyribonuclease-4
MLDRSRDALLIELERSAILGADYLVLHPGAHKESSLEEGIKKISASINYVIAKVEGNAKNKVKILIENTAGGGTRIGAEFSELAGIFDRLKQTYRVGICLDTAHAFQAGYPIHRPDGLEKTLREFERLVGLEKINLLHLNDSKTRFSSRNDRHWHIGKGEMGIDAFDRIINHPDLAHLPAILETPSSEEDDLRNMTTVKQLRKNSDRS